MNTVHNDNEASSFKNNNVNDNERGLRKILNTERIARDLVKVFNSQGSWEYYCDVANKLPENVIRNNVETALARAKTSPGGYFNRLCTASIYKLKQNQRG